MTLSATAARACSTLGLLLVGTALSGCVNVRYNDEHGDLNARMYDVSLRFTRTVVAQDMAGLAVDIGRCYDEATIPLIKRFALQDCLSYDYAAYTFDKMARKGVPRTPYFGDNLAIPRMNNYGNLDGFGSWPQLSAFLTFNNAINYRYFREPGGLLWNPARPRPPLIHGGGWL